MFGSDVWVEMWVLSNLPLKMLGLCVMFALKMLGLWAHTVSNLPQSNLVPIEDAWFVGTFSKDIGGSK